MDADGGDFLFANAAARQCPHTGKFADSLSWDAEVFAGENESLFHQPYEIDRAKMRTTFARKVATEVEDGVADELAGAVVSDIATAINLVNFGHRGWLTVRRWREHSRGMRCGRA